VDAGYFSALGAQAWRGRLPTEAEINGLQPVAVVSNSFWRAHLAASGGVGSVLRLNGIPHEVIGVLPPRVELPLQSEVWVPLNLTEFQRTNRSHYSLAMVGRLAPHGTMEQARTDLNEISARLARDHPTHNGQWRNVVFPLDTALLGSNSRSVLVLQAGTLLLLVMAMFNMSILLYAQAAQRLQETAVRQALGATNGHLVRESMLSTLALLLPGIGFGLAGAMWTLPLLGALNPVPSLAYYFEHLELRWDTAMLSCGLALGLGMLAGLVPASQQMSGRTGLRLGENTRSGGTSPVILRTQRWLMQGQLALTAALLFGALVLAQSYSVLATADVGYNTESRTALGFALTNSRYAATAEYQRFVRRYQDLLNDQAWVKSATVTVNLPVDDITWAGNFSREPVGGAEPVIQTESYYRITETYLEAMGLPLLRGRNVAPQDNADSPRVVLVSEAFAAKYWPGEDPVGQRLWRQRVGQIEISEVIGVVSDSIIGTPTNGVQPLVFIPLAQTTAQGRFGAVIVSNLDPALVLKQARELLWSLDPELVTTGEGPLADRLGQSLAINRFQSRLLVVLGGFALVLALLGLGGLAARTLSARRTEFAVRSALGAAPATLARMLFMQHARFVVGGAFLGLAGIWVTTRFATFAPHGVSLSNPTPYLATLFLLLGVALLSLAWPLIRASRVSPAETLRN
jgi:predicted permease